MSEAKFTNGNWELSLDIGGNTLIHCGGESICGGINCDHQGNNTYPYHIEAEANAHLIVAAPKMYALLEKLTSVEHERGGLLGSDGEFNYKVGESVFKDAKKLLAKARGES